jgi:hypothetical protein
MQTPKTMNLDIDSTSDTLNDTLPFDSAMSLENAKFMDQIRQAFFSELYPEIDTLIGKE